MTKKPLFAAFAALLITSTFFLSSCSLNNKAPALEGTSWAIRVFWTSQPHTVNVTFNSGGTVSCTDDTSGSYTGTWSASDGTVIWSLDAEGRDPSYRATYDNKDIEGTASDLKGDEATFTGQKD